MNESTLKSLIQALHENRDALNFWLNISAFAVVVGVVLEVVFVIRVYKEELHNWKRGIFLVPSRPSRGWLWFEIAGVALVSLGVAGEFLIDVKAADLDTQIRDANGKLVAILEKEAGDAKLSADRAADSAKTAHEESEAAKEVAGKAKTKADAADAASANTVRHLAVASRQLEALELTVKYRGPRAALLRERKNEFLKAMQPFSPQYLAIVNCVANREDWNPSKEQTDLRQEVFDLLVKDMPRDRQWGIDTGPRELGCASGFFGAGIFILYSESSDPTLKGAAAKLADEFKAAHIAAELWPTNTTMEVSESDPLADTSFRIAKANPAFIVLRIGTNPADASAVPDKSSK